jgi:hypothetical protein
MDIFKKIEEKRPNLKENSIKAYIIVLKKLNGNKEIKDLDFLADKEKIKEKLETLKLTTQRNYLTGVLVVLQAYDANQKLIDYYKNLINELNEQYTAIMSKNNKSEKQETNWTSIEELKKVFKDLEKEVLNMDLKNKIKIKPAEFTKLQDYLVAGLYTLLPPVRLDFAPMFIIPSKTQATKGNNYLINSGRNKKSFYIQEFKNATSRGPQTIEIPPKLNTIINMFLKWNDTNFFLLNNRKELMSANGLGKLISKVFAPTGKKITINLLRSIYVSENVDLDVVKKNAKIAEAMMHSTDVQQSVYYKDD